MKAKKVKTIKALKKHIKKSLPEKISKVIDSYESFLEKTAPDDAKGFSAHHTACKSAVVHAETLLKLAKWTNDDDIHKPNVDEVGDVWEIISEAKELQNEEDESEFF